MKKDSKSRRKAVYFDSLSNCDSAKVREQFLLDRIIELEDSLFELQHNYIELLINFKFLKQCVQVPF